MTTLSSVPFVDVVGVGLNAADTQLPVPHFPASGAKVVIPSAHVLLGGQVATAMAACQLWGLRTRYVGKLGDDHAAELHRTEFARLNIEAHVAIAKNCTSPQSFILVEPSGERTVLLKRDARLTLLPADLQQAWIENARLLHLDGHDTAAATQAARWARAAKIPVVADLDDLYSGFESLLPNIDYLIVSRDIPARLTNDPDLKFSLPEIAKRYATKLVAATLGHEGVLAFHQNQFHYAPAFQVPTADTTGAGDIFHAAFIYALLQNWPLDRQLAFANAAAALNCTAQGARGGIRPVSEILSLVANGNRLPATLRFL